MAAKTLYDKLWDAHEVRRNDDGTSIVYIDRHLLHEVTSAQAFEGLEQADRKPWRIDANLAVSDHRHRRSHIQAPGRHPGRQLRQARDRAVQNG